MRIAVLDDYQNVAGDMADWSQLAGHDVTFFGQAYEGADGFVERVAPFDIVCAMRERSPLGRDILERLPNLKLLATAGMRNAAIDLDCCRERGIAVIGTQGSGHSTPELAWGMIIGLARHIAVEDTRLRGGSWITTLGTDLKGATLGIVGLGGLGRRMARIAQAFEMRVVAWSINLTEEAAAQAGVERVGKEDLFRQSDFVSIHYKLGQRSRGLVGAAELALMKPTAYLVNTSRGPVVDTAALIDALKSGRIAGAGIDVHDQEPLPADAPILGAPNTILTPHLGYVTRGIYRTFYGQIVESVAAWLDGKPIRVLA